MKQVKKCLPNEFMFNMNELQSYRQAKKNNLLINTSERLILILKRYYETLIFYQENSRGKNIVLVKGITYKIEISGHDSDGKQVELELPDICEQLLKDVLTDIDNNLGAADFYEAIKLLSRILVSSKVQEIHKIAILNSEHLVFGERWKHLVCHLPEEDALEVINARKNVVLRLISNTSIIGATDYLESSIEDLHKSYNGWMKIQTRVLIFKNHFIDIIALLFNEAKVLNKIRLKEIDRQSLIKSVLFEITAINNLFNLEYRERIDESFQRYITLLGDETMNLLHDDLYFNPQNFELGDTFIRLKSPDFSEVDIGTIKTVISFIIPYQISSEYVEVDVSENTKFEFKTIKNLFDDPLFSFLDELNLKINGLPLTFFSDAVGRLSECTLVNFILDEFYHPDFDLNEGHVVNLNLDEEKAKRGGKYSPHKDLILENLWKLFESDNFPVSIERKDINSNFISNYLVSYLDSANKQIHHQVHLITNFNSYYEARNRFLRQIGEKYFSDDDNELHEYVNNLKITSRPLFLKFCTKLLELTLVKSIELGGLSQSFWNDKGEPKLERDTQPIIYNQLRYVAEIKGIRIIREGIAAEGSLDFAFIYLKNNIPMTVCVELKMAHHKELEHGINTQLPLYIKDIGSKEGIFLVLWYKSATFDQPKSFDTPSKLQNHLREQVPEGYNIQILVVDCTKKLSPSIPARTLEG